MAKLTERTSFTKDVEGRYLCNDVSEVNAWKSAGGRPFDMIVVGGGTFATRNTYPQFGRAALQQDQANKIKQCRRVATRYDKLEENYLAFVQLALIRSWLRR